MTSRRERSAETEQALKDAARRVFAERGYLNTKITDITAAAGRAAGSFYNHFTGKDDLLRALLEDMAVQSSGLGGEPGHNPDFSDPEAVRAHIADYWSFARANEPVLRAMNQAAIINDEFARLVARFSADVRRDVADHLDGLADKGLTLPAAPDASLAMVFLVVSQLLQAVVDGTVQISDEQAVDGLTRFVYRGLTGRDF
ncbi:TetR/AcrR family transcriptional regulator [Nocardia donostiensis]|uniref:TetR family transcriptional regulator n=1 Tax=Nocardia donostiensis TaxID=1538463 RepID=A0A1V2TLE2_9NOCA|nr:TetR/AcrR family transcriptional regulator [Nocardia donostiensis]ONM50350.1 TetR family transcriptional regulator [Nocardia donostiensis]OQS16013.1 TetR family transcriptional regulator [Nocardia donostiensis]OQS23745.1 TetR family transcriptional regulator [Nocardia donostiensis]